MALKNISEEMLQKIAKQHLSYEIQMFVLSYKKLIKGNLDSFETSSTLETFLIHARALFDFLYPQETRIDDVLAVDFFNDPKLLQKNLPTTLSISAYLKQRTSKELAHITYKRLNVTPEQKIWRITEIHDQILNALVIFFETLPEERTAWFTTIVKR